MPAQSQTNLAWPGSLALTSAGAAARGPQPLGLIRLILAPVKAAAADGPPGSLALKAAGAASFNWRSTSPPHPADAAAGARGPPRVIGLASQLLMYQKLYKCLPRLL